MSQGVMDMKMKIALATAALIALPAMGFAAGCNYDKQAMSCGVGSVYDADSNSCVATTT
jgi:BRCT domain type II-containing protein